MDTTVVMQTTNQLMSNPVTMVNEMPLDSLFIDMGQSIPEFTEDFDVQPDQVLLPNWDSQNAPNFYIVPSEFITTTTAAPTTTTTTTAFPVTIPTQTISIPVSFSTVNQTQPLQYQVQQQPQPQPQQQQQPLQYQTQQILVPIVYENVNTAVYAQQPHQFHHAAVAVVPSPTYSSPASVVAVAANSPPTMQISYSSSPVSSNNNNNNNKKRRTSNDDSDYDSDAQLSDYDSDLHIGSSPQHHSSGDSGPVKKITKHKRRRSKDAKIKVERNRGACEKHKRDRKRCPLDCPMRTDSPTKRQAKGSATAGSEVAGKSPLVAPQSTSPSMPAVQSEAASMIQQPTFIIEQQQQSQQNQLVVA